MAMHKSKHVTVVLCAVQIGLMAAPALAKSDVDTGTERYFAARLAEFNERDGYAFANYQFLFKMEPTSPAIANRLFHNAILQGDMATAVKAVRALEQRNETDATMPLLLFADAMKRRDWNAAAIAVSELEARSNFGFIAPVLSAWINIAQGKAHGFDYATAKNNPLLNYYASDQIVYLELASGNIAKSKILLNNFRNVENDFARDLIIHSAPILAANDQRTFMADLLDGLVEPENIGAISEKRLKPGMRLPYTVGMASIFARFSSALSDQNIPDQALAMARIGTWIDVNYEPAKLALSKSLYAIDRSELGFDLLSKIPVTSPYGMYATTEKIQRLSNASRGQEALNLAKAGVQQNPNSPRALLLLAQTHEKQGDFADAATYYQALLERKGAEKDTPRTKAHYLLYIATVTHKGGNWNKARIILEEANKLDPNNAYILNYLGFTLLERQQDIPVALDMVKRAYQIMPSSAAIADSLGWGYYLTGDYEKSVQVLESAVIQSGNDVIINEHMGDAYWKYGKRTAARYAWNTAAYKATDAEKLRLQNKIDVGLSQVSSDRAIAY